MQGPTRRSTARKPAKPGPAAARARSAGAKPVTGKAKPAAEASPGKAAAKELAKAPRKDAAKAPAEARAKAPEQMPEKAPEKAPERAKEKAPKPAKERTEPLNFRVTPEFRRAFKRAAAAQDCKKVELLERVFAEWSARNPGPATPA